jgi:hypothetical protein
VLRGATFVFRSGSDGSHLWVVVSDPLLNTNEVLILNLTTVRNLPFEDLSCVFQPGEHSWLTNESCIAYDYARAETSAYLDRLENGTAVRMCDPFPLPLLDRICAGATVTQNLELDYLHLLQDQGFV